MKVAAVQFEIRDEETKEERIERMARLLSGLKGYDLILLPEIWATGYFSFERYTKEAEPLKGPFFQRMAQMAQQLSSVLFAGSFVEQEGKNYYNTSLLFDANGELLATYRKIHLFRYGSKEGELLTRGEEVKAVKTRVGCVGLSTCYDLRFPELYRQQVELGAELLLVTSAWPHQRLAHWQLFNAVRALENQCFLISCNCVGYTHNVLLGGHSQVVDPWGVVRAQAGEQETVLTAEIDLAEVKRVREHFPQLKHRVLRA
ncbi:Nitrilase/cyanide hydratase and apolipoprotein N-acyltransferase [Caldalkalibacillus thermarum TA2.A1]|uniref:Carbon-nitrogen family hydrolase n=1 Tax=Caldalkalibacillus thermarum (strain TA2.A1) TaxID=986075 RepID=F5L3K7_CALTT|nr:carbon-nitrogen family hydrolase [Caldalkalibacillus thermarum]EGL84083.1 Nitrilase/cyanide hydratase and apolipoprotein N-acyltransferase [Caldalkalibacillus thermarum TA2.A1]QZT33446.1 carbon-nitrogen family hydrolase [Caldalkalibacillus thermarum TA2.A1]GGK16494.1 hydrolase [Caldalkalibacillus thermarum]